MPEKDMYLKKNSIVWLFFSVILIYQNTGYSNEVITLRVINYLENLKLFSSSFIQNDRTIISEGRLYIGTERVRVEYDYPTKILIILDENKAMYYDYELNEDEFFDPKKTIAWFFFEIFKNPNLFLESNLVVKDNNLIFEKEEEIEIGNYKIKIYFENNPIIIRKIEFELDQEYLELSIFDHRYNEEYDKNFFKLINPTFFDQGK